MPSEDRQPAGPEGPFGAARLARECRHRHVDPSTGEGMSWRWMPRGAETAGRRAGIHAEGPRAGDRGQWPTIRVMGHKVRGGVANEPCTCGLGTRKEFKHCHGRYGVRSVFRVRHPGCRPLLRLSPLSSLRLTLRSIAKRCVSKGLGGGPRASRPAFVRFGNASSA